MCVLIVCSSLFQLWEEDGLDLALIPYGCIATGPNSGFIEVVKNARTIAEVRTMQYLAIAQNIM